MKRIKLFEAFNNQKEIQKTNQFLICFGIHMFIKVKVNGLKVREHGNSFVKEFYYIGDETQSYFKGEYYSTYQEENMFDVTLVGDTMKTLTNFLKERKIVDSMLVTGFYPMLFKSLRFVIKPIIENEKNVSSQF